MDGILGKKIGITQVYGADGAAIPVTVLQAGPCLVVQRRKSEKDGYEAAGLPELWLVDTAVDRVIVHRRSQPDTPRFDVSFEVGAGEQLTTPLLPGLTLDVAELFDR